MKKECMENYKQFGQCIEYPMVIFEAESGKVQYMNYEAEIILGKQEYVLLQPARSMLEDDFWEELHSKKSLIWHRLRLLAGEREHIISGFVNEKIVGQTVVYTLMFQAQIQLGSLTLERVLNQAGIVSFYMVKKGEENGIEFISKNINMYGYTQVQFYDGSITPLDIIWEEDRKSVKEMIRREAAKHTQDYRIETKLITESRQLVPVRLQIHFVYNEYGMYSGLEVLVYDMREAVLCDQNADREELSSNKVYHTIAIEDEKTRASLQEMTEVLNAKASYYNVVMNVNGDMLTKPIGPMVNMGRIYDMLERPEFQDKFREVSQRIENQRIPITEAFVLGEQKIYAVFAPIIIQDQVLAYWVLVDFESNEISVLGDLAGSQAKLANNLIRSFCKEEITKAEKEKHKRMATQLQKEQAGKELYREFMQAVRVKGLDAIVEICQKTANFMQLPYVNVYVKNNNSSKYTVWQSQNYEIAKKMELSQPEFQHLREIACGKQKLLICKDSEDAFLRGLVLCAGVECMMICFFDWMNEEQGYVVFNGIDGKNPGMAQVIQFGVLITLLVSGVFFENEQKNHFEKELQSMIQIYDYLEEVVFVRNNKTDTVAYANKKSKQIFGEDIVGAKASDILSDEISRYKEIGSIRNHFVTNKKVTKWQTYMKKINQIMNVVEISMDTFQGEYSLIILKNSKQQTKNDNTIR